MDFLVRSSKVFVFLSLAIVLSSQAEARRWRSGDEIKITSFNIKWFGLGGSMDGSPAKEKRDTTLKKFINEHILPADVIVFQEVVDVDRLQKLLPKNWQCISYENPSETHQHVMNCVSEKLDLEIVDYDNNSTIETVAINPDKSRPAVRLNVLKDGKELFTLVGVHLKAYPEESDTREQQSRKIAQDLERNDPRLPVVITGDFNTYPKDKTGQTVDDTKRLLTSLNSEGGKFTHLPHNEFTYRSGSHKSQFDHFYISGRIRAMGTPDVFDVCSQTKNGQGFLDISYYNKNVSDHCPVSVTLSLLR